MNTEMSADFDGELLAMFDERLSRIAVPARRARAHPTRRTRALAAAAGMGLLLGGSATILQATAFADAQGVSCADIATKMKVYMGTAHVVRSTPPPYPTLPRGASAPPGVRNVMGPNGSREWIKAPPSDARSSTAPGSILAAGKPTATCTVDGVTIQVFDLGTSMAIRRLLPGQ